jgi:hypothetical protein
MSRNCCVKKQSRFSTINPSLSPAPGRTACSVPLAYPGCQIVYFQTKIPNLGKFCKVLKWKMLVWFVAIWYILWPFGVFYGIWYILWPFGVFYGIWYILWPIGILYVWPFGISYGHLVYFMANWYILWPFSIFYGNLVYFMANHLVYFMAICWSFRYVYLHVLVFCTEKNLATLCLTLIGSGRLN